MEAKKCVKCQVEKPLSEYYIRSDTKKPTSDCKVCRRAIIRKYHEENPVLKRIRERISYLRNPDRKARSGQRYDERVKEWRRLHPEHRSAQNAVAKAVRSGKLVRPEKCEECGKECKPGAYHLDPLKKLDVLWLCYRCQGKRRRKYSISSELTRLTSVRALMAKNATQKDTEATE